MIASLNKAVESVFNSEIDISENTEYILDQILEYSEKLFHTQTEEQGINTIMGIEEEEESDGEVLIDIDAEEEEEYYE